MNRRTFMKSTLAGAGMLASMSSSRSAAADDKIVVGVMGLGGRGTFLAESFAKRPDVRIAYLCDADTRRLEPARAVIEKHQQTGVKLVQDFRRILDDPSVQVLVNATPDHWHALGAILACQAGKDVYVEKPMTHTLWEGRKMIEAAGKYKRVIQVGMQSRSAAYAAPAREYVRSGKLGEVYLVRVFNMMQHSMQPAGPDQPVPSEVDFDLWSGPAPLLPYNQSRVWLNRWEYSCGAIPGDLIHQLDLARFLLDDLPAPKAVSHAGGVNALKDGRQIPDTQIVTCEYGPLTMMLESALWSPYMKKTPIELRDTDGIPDWPFNGTRIEILGTKGFMIFGRHGDGWQAWDSNGKAIESHPGKQGDSEHIDNFLQCVRTRNKPTADVENGHQSALLCHLANISYRVGNRKLEFDSQTETIKNIPEANQYLKRAYRQPWVIPDNV